MQRRLGCLMLAVLLAVVALATSPVAPVVGGELPVESTDGDRLTTEVSSSLVATGSHPDDVTVIAVEATGDHVPPVGSVVRAVDFLERSDAVDRTFAVDQDAEDPDVVVRVTSEGVDCEPRAPPRNDWGEFYCVDRATDSDGPTLVAVSTGLTAEGYTSAVAAALGRVAGHTASLDGLDLEEPSYATPWPDSDPVTVRIEHEADTDRDITPLVEETIRYWEANDERWGTYAADWELVDEPDADVTVAFVDEVESCGDHPDPGGLIGCAPVRTPDNLATGDERVRVVAGYDDETTLLILKHEFGHLYGVSHGDAPTDVMVDSISTTPR